MEERDSLQTKQVVHCRLPLPSTRISLYGSVKSTRVPTKLMSSSRSSSSSICISVLLPSQPLFLLPLSLSSSQIRVYLLSFPLSLLPFPPLSLSLSFCSTYCSGLLSHLQAPLSRSRIVNSLSYSLSLLSLTGSAPFYSASHRVARVRLLFVVHLMYAFLRARANVYTKGRSSLAIFARAPTS